MTTVHMFNPDNKYNLNNMRIEARKRVEKDDRTTIIHMHSEGDYCKGECETYEPEEE